MTERHIYRSNYASSSIIGLIPSSVVHHSSPSSKSTSLSGIVDARTRLAFVIHVLVDDVSDETARISSQAVIHVWRHQVYSLKQAILEPDILVSCVHPEYTSPLHIKNGHNNRIDDNRLATLLPVSLQGPLSGASLYWSSPSGILCYWDNILASNIECQASVRIPLHSDEYVTHITPTSGYASGSLRSSEMILIGTSHGHTWLCVRSTRPIELKARLLSSLHMFSSNTFDDHTSNGNSESGKRWLGGFVSNLFTPSKSSSVVRQGHSYENSHESLERNSVVCILPLPSDPGSAANMKPLKSQKFMHPSHVTQTPSSKSVFDNIFYTITSNGLIRTCTIVYEPREMMHVERCIAGLNVTPSLESCLSRLHPNDQEIDWKSIREVQVLSAAVDENSTCLALCIRVILSTFNPVCSNDERIVGRLYIIYCPVSRHDHSVTVGSVAWLNRHANDAVLSDPNPLECAGIAIKTDPALAIQDGNDADALVYVALQQRSTKYEQASSQQHRPVTISAVRFIRSSEERSHGFQIQIRDIDLMSELVPSVIFGCTGLEMSTDGFVTISSSGCVLNTRILFPTLATRSPRKLDTRDKELIQVLTGHLLSEFDLYRRRLEQHHRAKVSAVPHTVYGSQDDSSLRLFSSSLPPSILSASSSDMTLAAVSASKILLDAGFIEDSNHRGPTVLGLHIRSGSGLEIVTEKADVHKDFIDFLVQGEMYKKVRTFGRIELRSHGEMIHAIKGVLALGQEILRYSQHTDDIGDSADQGKDIINKLLFGAHENISDFHSRLKTVQLHFVNSDNLALEFTRTLNHVFTLTGRLICDAVWYRENESEHRYDISVRPGLLGWDVDCLPWTSSEDFLSVLENQLMLVHSFPKELADLQDFASLVHMTSCQLLDGLRDVNSSIRDEARYDTAKRLALSVIRTYCPRILTLTGTDLGFYCSCRHGYFEDIVQFCYDEMNRNEKPADSEYDLGAILSVTTVAVNVDEDNKYAALCNGIDYRSGLSFPKFVFRWFADKKLFGSVLELGRNCPDILTEYMEENELLFDFRWIQHVRNGSFSSASLLIGQQYLGHQSEDQDDTKDKGFKGALPVSLKKLN